MRSFLFLLAACAVLSLQAQKLPMDLVKNMKPRSIGPGGMSGRVTAIDVVENNPNVMYVGTASGGLWKSTSGGIKWEPVFENESTASIGSVAIQQTNPSVIWVGTGEGNPRNSLNGGYGIYRSLDGGKSWKLMGLEKTRHIHRIIIHPSNPDVVYAAAIGSPWGEHPERGVYKTTDGGKSWTNILFANDKTGTAELIMDPTNPNKLIAAMWEHKREPWFFNSGGPGSGLHITHDGGENWTKITSEDGLPEGDLGRIGVAIAPSSPNVVYALVESKKNAFYKSTDGGFNWKMVNDNMNEIGNRPFYYAEIYVDPQNENRVYSIFTYVNVSEDGGKSFEELMPAYGANNGIHPDHHAWWIHPEDGNFLIDGNDGGLNISRDRGKSWRFIGNLPVAQFYHINVDNEYPYNVYGGMQDNGSWRGPAYVWRDQGIRNDYWQEISFGDGFDVVPDPEDPTGGWSMSQQGNVMRYDWVNGNNYTIKPTHPDPEIKLRFNWNAAINIDPFNSSTLYFGSQYVHKSTDKGLTWEVISPDLTTNDPEKQKQHESGGLTKDATGAENYTTIIAIEPSPAEKDVIWVGTDDGNVQLTRNGGESWTELSANIKGLPKGSWIPQLKASKKNKGEVLLIANDYRRFNYTPYAFRTKDYGKTWERIVDGNDVESYTLAIAQDPEEENLLFLGTDDGLYVSMDAAKSWTKWTEGFPTVPVMDLVIHPREQDLVIGTFGRAAWVLDDIRPLRALAREKSILEKSIELFNPPTAYLASYQQPTGSRFGADAVFNGDNRDGGAHIKYYFKAESKDVEEEKNTNKKSGGKNSNSKSSEDTEKSEKKSKSDSLILNIYDGDRLIRTLKQKAPKESGIYTWNWGLDEKGVEGPSRRNFNRGNREPRGLTVLPGTYKVQLNFGEYKSETKIQVEADPRIKPSMANLKEVYNAGKKLEKLMEATGKAVKQLNENKSAANNFKKLLEEKDKKLYESQIKASKEIVKEIDSLVAIYLGKEDDRQGIIRSPEMNVGQRIGVARAYVSSRQTGLNETEKRLMNQANTAVEDAIKTTNNFFNNQWKAYTDEMDKVEIERFKPSETIKLD
ncbi:WD40/YVTN/BNR-like repeat-containing protein [Aegicerativicinus sediminis]|uniref:WD40/YVTN/BNR-like repeat-containing protein n=1 Tax=Aegicerativicinus sediminis TaxID=2893202 RepID=UPI001E656632|nr:hypothetical protein [Aegicerativicinus sediminis]